MILCKGSDFFFLIDKIRIISFKEFRLLHGAIPLPVAQGMVIEPQILRSEGTSGGTQAKEPHTLTACAGVL